MRIYIDMVSSEPPQHRGKDRDAPPWRPHAVRIAAAVEYDDRGLGPVLISTVAPGQSWRCDLEWIGRYAGDTGGIIGAQPADIIEPSLWLFDPIAIFVAHNAPFHRQVLDGLIQDAGGPLVENREWFCTMREAEPICNIPARGRSGTKAPSLIEAYQFFHGRMDDQAEILPARETALRQLNRIRTVYWGISQWGIPDPIPMPDG